MRQKLFTRDFTLVVIGQIVSLFGNAAIRFALPLYLLNETGSSALYGTVTACAFLPAILLSPVGGIVADRVNKRNIMVTLDFFTAGVIGIFSVLYNAANLIVLIAVTLMFLYGIAGAYQPSVQASIPALVSRENFMSANSVVNIINSFSSLLGPVLGGILYSAYGLMPILWVCIVCFFLSAVMEIFIRIPFTKQEVNCCISDGDTDRGGRACKRFCGGVWETVKEDFGKSIRFIRKEEPVIGKVLFMICGINLFLSAMLTVGLPYIETPQDLIGKVIAVILTISMCAQPVGNAMYGVLFEACKGFEFAVVLFAGVVSLLIAVAAGRILKNFASVLSNN